MARSNSRYGSNPVTTKYFDAASSSWSDANVNDAATLKLENEKIFSYSEFEPGSVLPP